MKEEDETCSEQDEEEEDELFSMPQATIVKPLMSPRKRTIQLPEQPYGKKRYYLHRQAVAKSIIYLILLISLLIGMAFLSLQLIKVLTEKNVLNGSHGDQGTDDVKIIGCTEFEVEEVWSHTLHQLLTETAFRLNDVNQDGTPDVIMGFATGADRYFAEPILCDLYFDGFHPCLGGLLALDGKTGDELWRHYTEHEVFAVNCNVDIDSDGVRDCLGGGRAGVFHAVSGATGALLWRFDEHEAKVDISNLYTPQFIRDMNGDGVQDVLAMHGGDPLRDPGKPVEKIGRLIFFSGFTGDILQWVQVPDKLESYYSPQVLLYNLIGDATYQTKIERYIDVWLPGNSILYTPKGLAFRHYWGSLRYSSSTAFLALVAAENGINPTPYRQFAKDQLGYILGDTGRSFVCGFGENPPVYPHHRSSSCPDLPELCTWDDFRSPDPNPQILYGALVGGPDENDDYEDIRPDYFKNEVTLDYNAGMQSAVAGLLHLVVTDQMPL
ncbi:uncharacterized protein LOC144360098 [Saccoglossus kowalevskii]